MRRTLLTVSLGIVVTCSLIGRAEAQDAPRLPTGSDVRFTIAEPAILDWLRAATPHTVTVSAGPIGTDLVIGNPRDLKLADGQASMKFTVSGRTLPFSQTISATMTLRYDQQLRKYFAVLSALPIQIPALGTIDLKDAMPRIELPTVFYHLSEIAGKQVGLRVEIRRLAIVTDAVEVAADVQFSPYVADKDASS